MTFVFVASLSNAMFTGTPIRMIWRGKSLRDVGRAAKKGAIGEYLICSDVFVYLWHTLFIFIVLEKYGPLCAENKMIPYLFVFFSLGAATSGVLETTMGTGSGAGSKNNLIKPMPDRSEKKRFRPMKK